MKTFLKRAAITCGILVTALLCMGIIFIDTTQNYWYVNSGFVKLIVSNQTDQAIMTVDTNTFRVGFNSNNTLFAFIVNGRKPTNTTTSIGSSAANSGLIAFRGGGGGDTTIPTTGTGGAGGGVNAIGGMGGFAPLATTNATGGAGGAFALTGGAGGGTVAGVATNSTIGGLGGAVSLFGGVGGEPSTASTQTVSGAGGAVTLTAGSSSAPSAGWSRKTSAGGLVTITAGPSGNSTRTNSGDGGPVNITAGGSGNVLTAPGNPGTAGKVNITAGAGGTGDTNANGGGIFLRGGNSSATPGNTYVGRDSAGSARGGLVVGLGEGAVTNVLFVRTNLDFPSTLAQTDFDIPVATLAGRTNAIVNVGPPVPAVLTGSAWSGFCSNGIVFVRFSVYGLAAKDPGIGDFEVEMKLYQ